MLAVRRGSVTSIVETDGLGSVIRTVAGSTPNAAFRYDSFGRVVAQGGIRQSPFAFQGRELDPESGLYYFRARYYDPVVGRFLTEDPIGLWGGSNVYAFVGNNPVNILDPEGLAPRTPARGAPNSVQEFPNSSGKTVRHYGPDGNAEKDIDYGHDHGAGDPHVHDWDWSKPGDERGKGRAPEAGEIPEGSSAQSCSIHDAPNTEWRDRAAQGAIILGAGLIAATIVEDLLTGGAGAWNDPATVGAGMTLIRSGWGRIPGAMRPAGVYP
jgi:RHS repeat-associated protein